MLLAVLALLISATGQPNHGSVEQPAVPAQTQQRQSTEIANRLVAAGDTTLSLYISGSGPVAIILEAGASSDHRNWSAVQPQLSGMGRVVSYDRAGYGRSGRSGRPP